MEIPYEHKQDQVAHPIQAKEEEDEEEADSKESLFWVLINYFQNLIANDK